MTVAFQVRGSKGRVSVFHSQNCALASAASPAPSEASAPQAHLLEIFCQTENQPCVLDFKVERASRVPGSLFGVAIPASRLARRPGLCKKLVVLVAAGHKKTSGMLWKCTHFHEQQASQPGNALNDVEKYT